ncbi:hypothetical protein COO59_18035 [Mixta theicola]|uniref:Uncharacterized protein n=1 Tax=Mixta theicola TaxID=1458355 RepID=A0A2K1Q5N3_9GAMM|nr:hypothetical protein [Mixta theicola]PNS10350.1 hypothetical protein COO59_18035 [Mixta theicola]
MILTDPALIVILFQHNVLCLIDAGKPAPASFAINGYFNNAQRLFAPHVFPGSAYGFCTTKSDTAHILAKNAGPGFTCAAMLRL